MKTRQIFAMLTFLCMVLNLLPPVHTNAAIPEAAIPSETVSHALNEDSTVPIADAEDTPRHSQRAADAAILAEGTCGETVTWVLTEDGTLTISGTGNMKGYTYNTSQPWYDWRSSLTAVVIEEGVTSIGHGVFENCASLVSVTIPSSVTSIDYNAFRGCTSLVSVSIPEGVTSIGQYAFEGCTSLVSVSIPEGVTTIGDGAFYQCSSLTAISLPDTVTTLGRFAFQKCSSLREVRLSSNLTAIASYAFSRCVKLQSIRIPEGVTGIGTEAFYDCKSLETVYLPGTLTDIGTDAFYPCLKLTRTVYCGTSEQLSQLFISSHNNSSLFNGFSFHEVDRPADCITPSVCLICEKTVTEALGHSWKDADCQNPKTCTVCGVSEGEPSGLHVWQEGTCATCGVIGGNCGDSAYWVLSEDGVLTISGSGSMQDFPGTSDMSWYAYKDVITAAVIEDGITGISGYAFYNCTALTTVTVGKDVKKIGNYAFSECPSLAGITVSSENPYFTSDAHGVLFDRSMKMLIKYPAAATGAYTVPDTVQVIGSAAFYGCSNLTALTLPATLTTIENQAFRHCSALTSLDIPSGVQTIGIAAFYGCSGLTSIALPENLTVINETLFYKCTALETVAIPAGVTSINANAFRNCNALSLVIFCGTQEQWDAITIGSNNTALTDAQLQYHSWSSSSCTVAGTCTVCGTVKEAAGHNFEDGVCAACKLNIAQVADLDGDGKITAFDAQILAEALANCRSLTEEQWDALAGLVPKDIVNYILGR